jgi:hypothetical protein
MEMHGRAVAGLKIEHPGAKIFRAEEMAVANLLLARLVDFPIQVDKFHRTPSARILRTGTYRAAGWIVKLR